jgi:hypothetical protein
MSGMFAWLVCAGRVPKRKPPLSRTNCEGGVGGDTSTEEIPPPSRISSEGGGGGRVLTENPSVLQFVRGGGLVVIRRQKKYPLRLAFRARGGVLTKPLRLAQIVREGSVVICRQKKYPLCLAFRVREGVEGVEGCNTTKRDHLFVVLVLFCSQ